MDNTFQIIKNASRELPLIESAKIEKLLLDLADEILKEKDSLLKDNQKDLNRMDPKDPKYDRLKLTKERLDNIASDMKNVAKLPDPVGETFESKILPNGLKLSKRIVPLGVVGVIFEARPNVVFDVFSLCFKTHNACLLKGGSDAKFSNEKSLSIIQNVLKKQEINPNCIALLKREETDSLLKAHDFVDVIIPRGSSKLIEFVRENAKIPVIETGAGIVHCFVDEQVDIEKTKKIIKNAKTRRVSVCNALDTLIIHEKQLNHLPELITSLQEHNVTLFADEKSYDQISKIYPSKILKKADKGSFGTEFLDYKMAIKTVSSLDEALEHINRYSSKHTEAILSSKKENIEKFLNQVDAACVMANTSTGFTDGAQFGLGAEIGISTQKIHARGPMGLRELTTYKWIVEGDGQIRS